MILVILMKGDCSAFPVNFIFNHAIALDVAHALLDNLNQPYYKIDLGKLLSLSSVGQNVNKVVWKIIDEHLKAEDLHGLLPFIPCSLHVAHSAFHFGLKEYGSEVDQLCLDLFYWFKQSPCKQEDFLELEVLQEMELNEKYFIRHVQSRWLTLGPATERVIRHYAAVCDYFLKHLLSKEHVKNNNYRRICACLKDKNTITKFKFVSSLANIFEPFLNYSRPTAPLFIFSMINAVLWLRGCLVDI